MKIPYSIHVSPYKHYHGGVKVLHTLNKLLNEAGYESHIMEKLTGKFIAIYPEKIEGNPLEAPIIVRYFLERPGKFKGPTTFDGEELFTFSKLYYDLPDERVLFIPTVELELFNNIGTGERKGDCYYIGKGTLTDLSLVKGMTEITLYWPPTREELADLLRRTETLYTFYENTVINDEALMCGCKVIKCGVPYTKELYTEASKKFPEQFKNFIRITQSL